MKVNIPLTKSKAFAIRIVILYKYLCEEKGEFRVFGNFRGYRCLLIDRDSRKYF